MFKVGDQVIHVNVPNVVWTVREVLDDTCNISPNQEFNYFNMVYAKDVTIGFIRTYYLKYKHTVTSKIRELEERHLSFLKEKQHDQEPVVVVVPGETIFISDCHITATHVRARGEL